ncbi:unnamed protein product [Caenorhabditis sp. 36 PRJEB53466]|nr:unnamed protein product [Caenorhabditis sp. 36 PRJEB53466]
MNLEFCLQETSREAMIPIQPGFTDDPVFRQKQLRQVQHDWQLYEQYCQEQRLKGLRVEPPQFNSFGHVINKPKSATGFPQSLPQSANTESADHEIFTLCFPLADPNSPGRELFNQIREMPKIPQNCQPRVIMLLYDTKGAQSSTRTIGTFKASSVRTTDVAVGDFSVVRYNAETQTEWSADKETDGVSRRDNEGRQSLHNPITQTVSKTPMASNMSEPDGPVLNMALHKVSDWLSTQNAPGGDRKPFFVGSLQSLEAMMMDSPVRQGLGLHQASRAARNKTNHVPFFEWSSQANRFVRRQDAAVPIKIVRRHSPVGMSVNSFAEKNEKNGAEVINAGTGTDGGDVARRAAPTSNPTAAESSGQADIQATCDDQGNREGCEPDVASASSTASVDSVELLRRSLSK